MIDAGILPGDVVVEKRQFANDGEMVVTTVDNEFTLKTLAKKRAIHAAAGQQGVPGHPSEGATGNIRGAHLYFRNCLPC